MINSGFNNWRNVWESKTLSNSHSLLSALIQANGFDTGCGDYSESQWLHMAEDLVARAQLDSASSVLEFGCGSGALLLALQQLCGCTIAGSDYSSALVDIARTHLSGVFVAGEARDRLFPANQYDMVLSHSVFQYFPSMQYAEQVIDAMLTCLKSGGTLFLLDLNDQRKESDYHAERMSGYKTPHEYQQRYQHHPHQFYQQGLITEMLTARGCHSVTIFPHAVREYKNASFRFNVMATLS
ncbi:class I SAM-dependent methyltransferase [Plesiomonas shigelloides]|uniref:class I SAM-dependent methyltransferase n=1 Tax=Plesiomonas shigelloides TaxID=703 RepID=UPI0007ED981B|nr:class I SAM-dependent methyltransferase [Plesiomonas shigelloides]KAB7691146.1 methyltransferase domain-containing protein [Plesiomonas shigelloides]SBT59594.1 Chondramide synthase cmdD [Plesiomonas shigelloides]